LIAETAAPGARPSCRGAARRLMMAGTISKGMTIMRYLIIATDAAYGNTTVYYSIEGWQANRAHGTRYPKRVANRKLDALLSNSNVTARFIDIAIVAA